jgi:tetratricopeptide (TPR) repeat protein
MTNQPISPNYLAGQTAFENGNYRQSVDYLEAALTELKAQSTVGDADALRTKVGGEMQMWLVTAYEASGNLSGAIELCSQLLRHPHLAIRQESKRILYILQAPELNRRDEWIIKIPDLQEIEENPNAKGGGGSQRKSRPVPVRKMPPPKPIDPSEIETKDNGFLKVLLVLAVLAIGGLYWAAQ